MNQAEKEDYLGKMYHIIGAAMSLYNELGHGFTEPVYQECLSIVCSEKGIPWEREKLLKMSFHGQQLQKLYKADFICYGDVIVELKTVSGILPEHRAQLFNYLRLTGIQAGLIINFGNPDNLVAERYLYDTTTKQYHYISSAKR